MLQTKYCHKSTSSSLVWVNESLGPLAALEQAADCLITGCLGCWPMWLQKQQPRILLQPKQSYIPGILQAYAMTSQSLGSTVRACNDILTHPRPSSCHQQSHLLLDLRKPRQGPQNLSRKTSFHGESLCQHILKHPLPLEVLLAFLSCHKFVRACPYLTNQVIVQRLQQPWPPLRKVCNHDCLEHLR